MKYRNSDNIHGTVMVMVMVGVIVMDIVMIMVKAMVGVPATFRSGLERPSGTTHGAVRTTL